MKKSVGILFFCCMLGNIALAQISPPGLGKVQAASWFALALRQDLDTLHKKQSVTYIGLGRISDPSGDGNPFKKQAMFVLNEELYNHYRPNWQYSYALSYRRQNLYEDTPPFAASHPNVEQEFRIYGRYAYITGSSKLKWTTTLRQEFRKFFDPAFKKTDENFQFRTRLKTQLAVNLDQKNIHKLTGSAEALFSISRDNFPEKTWTGFSYRESRFCLYYTLSPQKIPLVFDLGYMNNLLGKGHSTNDAHYLALDIIWENPFGKIKPKKVKVSNPVD
ncbi:MAG TPA: hypothetical protein VEV16_07490 [Daejeonella sp.]|nr:hypothetical protein [Daejeonella sp.]